jgi:hypothetical protein
MRCVGAMHCCQVLKAVYLSRTVKSAASVASELLSRPTPSWQRSTFRELQRR